MLLEASGAAATPPKETVRQEAEPKPEGPPASYGSPAGVYEEIDVVVPDIGDFKDVPVIEVHVKPGDTVKAGRPADHAGIRQGQHGYPGALRTAVSRRCWSSWATAWARAHTIMRLRTGQAAAPAQAKPRFADAAPAPAAAAVHGAKSDMHAEVLVLGAGPGGYSAAFRAADLGKKVVLVERWADAGRRLPQRRLHPVQGAAARAKVVSEAQEMAEHGHAASPRRNWTSTSCAVGRKAWSSG